LQILDGEIIIFCGTKFLLTEIGKDEIAGEMEQQCGIYFFSPTVAHVAVVADMDLIVTKS